MKIAGDSTKIPRDIGPIHFVGIGGIGMSGIAEMLHRLGYQIQGSDQHDSANVGRLRARGIPVFIGHDKANVAIAQVVVVSSAISQDNCELREARTRHLPIVKRAEMLAELMRFKRSIAVAGSHGKTTTTSLVAALLDAAGQDPTVINGGIINAYAGNARMGSSDYMVVEADESDGSFLKLPMDYAVVTNIDPEHLDHFGDFEHLQQAFVDFVENIPFFGRAVMCLDHPHVQRLISRIEDRQILTYGFSAHADLCIEKIVFDQGHSRFDVKWQDKENDRQNIIADLMLPMIGEHNILNAGAAITLALALDLPEEAIREGLAGFGGIKRRFTHLGQVNGMEIYDDYAHHPVEICAVLKAARHAGARVFAIMQPHRYSRLAQLFDAFSTAFNDADIVILTPVYDAGEAPIEDYDHMKLAQAIRAGRHSQVFEAGKSKEVEALIRMHGKRGDCIIFMGAGSISSWASEIVASLQDFVPGAAQ